MARIHARTRGKASSSKPYGASLDFVKFSKEEIVKMVIDLAKEKNMPAAKIGLFLRDNFGIADVKELTGKKITQILGENDLKPEVPEDLANLVSKIKKLKKHLEENKKDVHNRRSLILLESKANRLVRYYRRRGVLGNSKLI